MNVKEEALLHITRVHSNLLSIRKTFKVSDIEYQKLTKDIKKCEEVINDLTQNMRS